MSLQEYKRKRDPSKTREPFSGKSSGKHLIFVVQEHWASHLHYDFRLEAFGALKSWAVPKGPSTKVGDKRLAVEVEDHPLDYAKFHGTIPQGEYGAGTVKIWDKGVWFPPDQLKKHLQQGRLEFELKGKKLKGKWLLIRTRKSTGQKSQWLLIKRTDEALTKVKERPLQQVFEKLVKTKRKSSAADPWPEEVQPQLALLSKSIPRGNDWIHEIKLDGYRTLVELKGKKVRILTRSRLDWTAKYSPLDKEFLKLKAKDAILDGEIVAMDAGGKSNFGSLQKALKDSDMRQVFFYAFDLLFLNGTDLRGQSLDVRKQLLKKLLKESKSKKTIYSEHWLSQGEELYSSACSKGLEGIVSKNRTKGYVSARAPDWKKIKCSLRQEFVVGGFTEAEVAHRKFGALLLGVYEGRSLRYVGRVGTGFDTEVLSDLSKELSALETNVNPFHKNQPHRSSKIHWVRPKLVVEVEFKAWTGDGLLRQASYQGLREDKKAVEVHDEKTSAEKKAQKKSQKKSEARRENISVSTDDSEVKMQSPSFKITHPDRVIYADTETTKLDVANYYRSVAPWLLKHLGKRPLSLMRCPEGAGKACFFQKHVDHFKMEDVGETLARNQKVIYVNSTEGLLQLIQWGVLELHTWQTHIDHLDYPDQMVFDLDPDPSVPWKKVVNAATYIRDVLKDLKLKSFVKTTGGKGLHIHVPIVPEYTWDQVKSFSKTIVKHLELEDPTAYTSNILKSARKNKIFLDYLRNGFSATSVAPYSLRARDHAFVAVPITWQELKEIKSPGVFDLNATLHRLARLKSDPWPKYFSLNQKIKILEK